MRYSSIPFVGSLLVVASFLPAAGQTHLPSSGNSAEDVAGGVSADERPMSIFNDKIRRFRFDLEGVPATHETAEAFNLRYNKPDNPKIIGAYPDPQSNSLLVIGPPEAEQAIRASLAEWFVELQGAQPPSLEARKRSLKQKRAELLREMAELEIQRVEAAAQDDAPQVQQLNARLDALEDELRVIQQQIEVVDKYLERLHADETSAPAQPVGPAMSVSVATNRGLGDD